MPDAPATPVAARGLEVAAAVLSRAFDAVAVVDGDGALRLAAALAALGPARAAVLPARGVAAAWEAFGRAAAGEHVALVASGRDAVSALVPLLREAARVGVGLTVALPAHGDEGGRAVPGGPCDDLALALDQPVGVLVAGGVAEVANLTLAALTLARVTARPWCVAFELARVGYAAASVTLPDATGCARWRPAAGLRSLDEAWAHVRALAPALGPVAGAGASDGSDVSAGVAFAAEGIGLRQLRPFPAEALAAAAARGALRVREPWPDAWGGGRLTAMVRLALGAGASVFEGSAPDGDDGCDARVDLCVDEPRRGAVVREALVWLSRCGVRAEAACHEPWAATLRLRFDARPDAPLRGVICELGALGLPSVLAEATPGAAVIALGPGDPSAARDVCLRRGCALRCEPDAHLAPTACPKA